MADPDTTRLLDTLMAELAKAPGFTDLFATIEARQDAVLRALIKAPKIEGTTRADLYHLIGQYEAYGVVRGLPESLANEAVRLRAEDQKKATRVREPESIVHTARSI